MELKDPMKIYCDNKAIINIAHNPIKHDQIKHIKVDRHIIKENIKSGMISTPFVTTKQTFSKYFHKNNLKYHI